jgi:serine/threonine protein kinase
LFLRTFDIGKPHPLDSLVPEATTEARDLMQQLLHLDPVRRPSASACFHHRFFKHYPLPQELKGIHPLQVPQVAFEHEKWKPGVEQYREEILKEGNYSLLFLFILFLTSHFVS